MIRLVKLDASGSICLETFDDERIPSYAILSHTWIINNAEELTYNDVTAKTDCSSKRGYEKVYFCLQQAARDGIIYCWVDTCCINKDSSQELNEAITSMFSWYKKSARCYVFLADVSGNSPVHQVRLHSWTSLAAFKQSRWFTRGWTLQELLAPSVLEFFSAEWTPLGDREMFQQVIHEITGIPTEALRQEKPLAAFDVKERKSWTKSRITKRPEDMAYCLLGIFNVTVIPQYGEGETRATDRLEEAIERSLRRSSPGNKHRLPSEQSESHDTRFFKKPRLSEKSSIDIKLLTKSLSFSQIEARRITIEIARHQTCKWLLTDPQFTKWLNTESQDDHDGFLWIKGKPGSGKSTIMKFALESVRKTAKHSILLSFFFNARGFGLEKSVAGAYRTLIVQLLEQVPSLHSVFHKTLGTRVYEVADKQHDWDVPSLQALLTEAIRSLEDSSVVCFIDALDECDEAEIRDMIYFLDNLCRDVTSHTHIRLRVCFASRHYPHITAPGGQDLILEDKRGHEQDIVDYLSTELRIGKGKLADDIRLEVLKKASGVFMWIVLVVRVLNKVSDQGGKHLLRQKLAETPSDIHELFMDILMRDSDKRTGVKLCIQWILFAKEPLTARQLYYAILSGTDLGSAIIAEDGDDSSDANDLRFINDHSKGLAEITKSEKNPVVQFIHESVKDFLLKEKGFEKMWTEDVGNVEGRSHESLKECCLSYANAYFDIDNKSISISSDTESTAAFKDAYPFLKYAAEKMLYHADEASKHGVQQSGFLLGFETSRWTELLDVFKEHLDQKYKNGTSLQYLLAEMNASNLIQEYSEVLSYLQPEKQRYGTPLFAALAKGNKAAVLTILKSHIERGHSNDHGQLLFRRYSEDPDWRGDFGIGFRPRNGQGFSAHLIEFGSSSLFELFKETGILDVSNFASEQRATWEAAEKGRFWPTLNLIKETNGEISHISFSKMLIPAISHGRQDVIELLLHKYAGMKTNNELNDTIVAAAAKKGRLDLVKMFLSKGADVSRQGDYYGSALINASSEGYPEIVKLLLDRGADINIQGGFDNSALQAASRNGHLAIVELLLDRGADVNIQGGYFGSALQAAISYGQLEIVELLLNRGADVNILGVSSGRACIPPYRARI